MIINKLFLEKEIYSVSDLANILELTIPVTNRLLLIGKLTLPDTRTEVDEIAFTISDLINALNEFCAFDNIDENKKQQIQKIIQLFQDNAKIIKPEKSQVIIKKTYKNDSEAKTSANEILKKYGLI